MAGGGGRGWPAGEAPPDLKILSLKARGLLYPAGTARLADAEVAGEVRPVGPPPQSGRSPGSRSGGPCPVQRITWGGRGACAAADDQPRRRSLRLGPFRCPRDGHCFVSATRSFLKPFPCRRSLGDTREGLESCPPSEAFTRQTAAAALHRLLPAQVKNLPFCVW